jgi:hypothetical protein
LEYPFAFSSCTADACQAPYLFAQEWCQTPRWLACRLPIATAAASLDSVLIDLLLSVLFACQDVGVIDRDVMRFFVRCEADGVKVENCAPYIREWMEREKD